jgi:hypothetical protein
MHFTELHMSQLASMDIPCTSAQRSAGIHAAAHHTNNRCLNVFRTPNSPRTKIILLLK